MVHYIGFLGHTFIDSSQKQMRIVSPLILMSRERSKAPPITCPEKLWKGRFNTNGSDRTQAWIYLASFILMTKLWGSTTEQLISKRNCWKGKRCPCHQCAVFLCPL